jgi:hypothetical protein
MSQGIRAARVALLMVVGLLLGAGTAPAQADAVKPLVGTWKGEFQQLLKKGADTTLVLIIKSVTEQGGKWVADGRLGFTEAKTAPVKIDVDTSGSKPTLRFAGAGGTAYSLNLMDDKNLVGTATLTSATVGQGSRDRTVRLEKQ